MPIIPLKKILVSSWSKYDMISDQLCFWMYFVKTIQGLKISATMNMNFINSWECSQRYEASRSLVVINLVTGLY